MTKPQNFILSRRRFVGAASVVLGAAANATSVTPAIAYNPGAEEMRSRYRDSAHVQAFYRVNGYETLKKSKP